MFRPSSKRRGLDKAVHQIEQAVKRPDSGVESKDARKVVSDLQELLAKAQGQPLEKGSGSVSGAAARPRSPRSSREDSAEDNLALHDAENPLQLLARASDLQLPPQSPKSPVQLSSRSADIQDQRQPADLGVNSFFVPVKDNLDIGPDLDPVDIGLATLDESEALFSLYVQPVQLWELQES